MNFDHAAGIIDEVAPLLLVDPPSPALPNAIVVRKSKGGPPFSITLPTTADTTGMTEEQIAKSERDMLVYGVNAALAMLPAPAAE